MISSNGIVRSSLRVIGIALAAILITRITQLSGNMSSSESSTPPKSVFISYSTLDRTDAFLLKRVLEQNGFSTWLDVFDIRTAGKIEDDLFGIISQHDLFALLLSPNSVASTWVNQEIEVAKSISSLRLLPIILRPCEIPVQLQDIIGFDAREGLNSPSLQARLLRAVNSSHPSEGLTLLDATEKELLHRKALQDHAQKELPQVMSQLDEIINTPMHSLTVNIKQDSLPNDLDTVLEVALKLDPLGFHGTMSIFIARYQEGRTWPAGLELEELTFNHYFLLPNPRLDIRLRYYDQNVQLGYVYKESLPMTAILSYFMDFDGEEFQPYEKLALPQKYELPSLSTMVAQNSIFELKFHSISGGETQPVPDDTDIWIEVFGRVRKNGPSLRLYRSHTSRAQHNILQVPYLSSPPMSRLVREALLDLYFRSFTLPQDMDTNEKDVFAAIEKLLEEGSYKSDDSQRIAAYYALHTARSLHDKGQNKAAAPQARKGVELLYASMKSGQVLVEDATYIYRAIQDLARLHFDQHDLLGADYYLQSLLMVLEFAVNKAPETVDLRRMLSKALFWKAGIELSIERSHNTVLPRLSKRIDLLLDIYFHAPIPPNWQAAVGILGMSIELYHKHNIDMPDILETWQNTLRPLVPSEVYEELTAAPSPPEQIPLWLMDTSLEQMPTKEVKSATGRYSLRIPESWHTNYKLRGTHLEMEHIYYGPTDAEWIMIGFIDKAGPGPKWALTKAVGFCKAVFGLPFMNPFEPHRKPKLVAGSDGPLVPLPVIVRKMNASEAAAMRGVCEVAAAGPQEATRLARFYMLLVRKDTFIWKITLSINTKLPPIALEKQLGMDDHLRAGAILGQLKLSGPSEQLP